MAYNFLIHILNDEVAGMCGVGTRYVKLYLNSLVKDGDDMAFIVRSLLECEMHNVNAKKYRNTYDYGYRDNYYKEKYDCVNKLIGYLLKNNPYNIKFGFQKSDVPPAKYIVYFYHPYFGQISFHCDISKDNLIFVQPYKEEWDKIEDSSLFKLECCIDMLYGKGIREKYCDKIKESLVNGYRKRIDVGYGYILRSIIVCGGFDYLLVAPGLIKEKLQSRFNMPNGLRFPFNKWILSKVGDNVISGCNSVEELYCKVRDILVNDEKLSFLSNVFDRTGLGYLYYGATDDDIDRVKLMFQKEKFNCNFGGLSELELNKLGSCLFKFSNNKRRNIRLAFCKYLVKKYGIGIDYKGNDKPVDSNLSKSKRKRLEREKLITMNNILMDGVIKYVTEHKGVKTYGIL